MSDRSAGAAADYSHAAIVPCPHDLLRIDPGALPIDAPDWARRALAAGEPVVVRRAPRHDGRGVPVGVRGTGRGQRHGAWIDAGAICGRQTPESLAAEARRIDTDRPPADRTPALCVLPEVAARLDAEGWRWGVTGAVGFQLAARREVCRPESDLDLLLRVPRPLARSQARALYAGLQGRAARCDVQLETPAGGVALADWAGSAREVLIKHDTGPYLAADPWRSVAAAGRARVPAAP